MKTVVICSGGPEEDLCSFENFRLDQTLFIGADRGALYLVEQGIVPAFIVGDFDSLTQDEWEHVSRIALDYRKVGEEKDETDTDLALLKALSYQPEEVYLTGVTGGRLDHYEAALRSMYRFQKKFPQTKIKIMNALNEISILFPGEHTILRDEKFRYISFFAYDNEVENVTLRGVKYETTNDCIEVGTSRFTSNELISSLGYISFSSGICLMIRSSD
ncbi:thiamine diphosphokinase [Lysinibacillus yapensis]|uniref:Thiamine diphosphokinase n=1 Tax=Ureibacillus yapensis TaxID=2304605 RepID=A0A396ST87_9BACL|nr:thiamine diphosphokinase [Lysinibacillus yapensis]RHW39691.1 thiamine diphosphokinase [Lysinibacillus yapensis]